MNLLCQGSKDISRAKKGSEIDRSLLEEKYPSNLHTVHAMNYSHPAPLYMLFPKYANTLPDFGNDEEDEYSDCENIKPFEVTPQAVDYFEIKETNYDGIYEEYASAP